MNSIKKANRRSGLLSALLLALVIVTIAAIRAERDRNLVTETAPVAGVEPDIGGTVSSAGSSGLSGIQQDKTQTEGAAKAKRGETYPPLIHTALPFVDGDGWPQVQGNAQRTGFVAVELGTHFQLAWNHPFQPEKVFPQVQAIVSDGKVFVGTEMGNLYALEAGTGARAWVFRAGGAILNSVAAGSGRVFFGAMDGAVYAVNSSDGSLAWKAQLSQRLGFSTAPTIADNKLLIGGRNGVFYALNPNSGDVIWQYNAGAPILQTAAWNNRRAYFGVMDMHVVAVNTSDGSLAWKSQQIPGMAFKDYWPVVHKGYVIVRPMAEVKDPDLRPDFPFIWFSKPAHWDWLSKNGATVAAGKLTNLSDAMKSQDKIMAKYAAAPQDFAHQRNLFILNESNGQEAFVVPHFSVQTMNGTTTPPCVDRDGRLIVPVLFVRSGWGRLDLNQRRIVDILYDNRNKDESPMSSGDDPAGTGNFDETLNLTCTRNLVIAMHTEEYNANYTGAFDLDNRRWTQIGEQHTSFQLSTNTQGGGGNPASISNGMIYHISFNELIVRVAKP